MGLIALIIGLIVLLGAHVFVTFRGAREQAIEQLGQGGYRILFTLVSLAGLVFLVWGYGEYRAHEWLQIWTPPRRESASSGRWMN